MKIASSEKYKKTPLQPNATGESDPEIIRYWFSVQLTVPTNIRSQKNSNLSKINFAKNLQNNIYIFVFIHKNKNLNTLCFPRKVIRKTAVYLLSEMRFQVP